ncbi:hypothetical protein EON67_05685, partial [archaeon]
VLFPALLYWSARAKWTIVLPRAVYDGRPLRGFIPRALQIADYAQRAALVLCYMGTLFYKSTLLGRVAFLLMPCHLHTKGLLYLSFTTARSSFNNKLAFIVLCLNWGTWLALALPDTADLKMPLEVPHFWISHILLVTLPATWLLRRRYHIYSSWHGLVATCAVFDLIAIFPVQILSVLFSRNITYMMMPPKAMAALFGTSYRKFFGLLCVPTLILITRYLFANIFIYSGCLHRRVSHHERHAALQHGHVHGIDAAAAANSAAAKHEPAGEAARDAHREHASTTGACAVQEEMTSHMEQSPVKSGDVAHQSASPAPRLVRHRSRRHNA